MIVIDTSVVVEYLIQPRNEEARIRVQRAVSLFESIEFDHARAILSEVVIHESYYVTVMRLGLVETGAFVTKFRSILSWPGWAMGKDETAIYLHALDILEAHPKLEFSDATIAARAWAHDAELATFDSRLADAYGGTRWADS